MTPEIFKAKWQAAAQSEMAGAQEHFIDLCRLLEVPTPTEADPTRTWYRFEKNVLKLDGRPGRADVWKRGCFAWEYKGNRKNLTAAYSQIKEYADALENPPLLIVSDMREIRIHTNFTNALAETHVFQLADLNSVSARQKLKWAFTDPERLRPTITREKVTAAAATAFGGIARKLIAQGYERRRVAHFLNKLVFCLFAQDIELLLDRVVSQILDESLKDDDQFVPMLGDLFRAMRERNGRFGATRIPWFNGGLFDDDDVLPLHLFDIKDVVVAARLDWSAIEPAIFGTLFERGLDPEKRKQMASLFEPAAPLAATPAVKADRGVGIHYTDAATIMKIIEPVVLRPLRREWEAVKAAVAAERAKAEAAKRDAARTRHEEAARDAYRAFRDRLGRFRVLDPACGSGNFLYLSLTHLKDFDLAVVGEAQDLGLPMDDQRVTPQALFGIEINPYAAELARVTIWIGELQWQRRNYGFDFHRAPILDSLPGIECRDALLNPDGSEAEWPAAEAIVGNPPFLGDKKMLRELGPEYVQRLRTCFSGRVPGGADLVTYWFAKLRALFQLGGDLHAGLVATNSIRGGASRKVLDDLCTVSEIYDAWSDEPWIIDGASVRVSLVCFSLKNQQSSVIFKLDGNVVESILSNVTAATRLHGDFTCTLPLKENYKISFQGPVLVGPFDVPRELAAKWLQAPLNPNGKSNCDVVRPLQNGRDITSRSRNRWVIDFGRMAFRDACLYEAPFEHVKLCVKPIREENAEPWRRQNWWLHGRTGDEFRKKTEHLSKYLATSQVAKHRFFVWLPSRIQPHQTVIAIARDDDTTFGILHSRFHELWSLRLGTSLEDRPRYTPTTTFETFPFPEGLTPNIPAADYAADPRAIRIAEVAQRLNELRENWLNPADLVRREPEVVPGYPDRILPVSEKAAQILKKRTLTNLYNERPAWLDTIHRELDAAVAAAYGWPAELADDEILKRLLELNLARAAAQAVG